jgi:HlyD family secretion protein
MRQVLKPVGILLASIIGAVLVVRYLGKGMRSTPIVNTSVQQKASLALNSDSSGFSALGQLEPVGRIRDLAAPTQMTDMQPRISAVLVEEGQQVHKGELLAVFDTNERLSDQREAILLRLTAIQEQVNIMEKETSRYRALAQQNAYPKSDLEAKELKLLDLKAEAIKIRSEVKSNELERRLSQLISPISGRVLKINARAGERPSPFGFIKVGQTNKMMAVVQVNEEYIGRVALGQRVMLRSENMSFPGFIAGRITHISPIVGSRKALTVDPKVEADKEARVVDVEVTIDSRMVSRLENLTGAKVIAIFRN